MRRPDRVSVRTTIGMLIVVVLCVTAAAALATRAADVRHGAAQAQAARAVANSAAYEDALGGAYNEWVSLISYYVLQDPAYIDRFDRSRAGVEASLAALRLDAELHAPAQVAVIDGFVATHQRFADADARVIESIKAGNLAQAVALSSDSNLTLDAGQFLDDLQVQLAGQRAEIREAQVHQRQAEASTVRWSLGIGSVCAGMLVLVGGASYWWIGRPLGQARAATRAIAAGDTSARVRRTGPSELADLADDVNSMADALLTRSAELSAYLSKNLETRTSELEQANADLAREVEVRANAEAALARTLAAERELEGQLRHQAFHDHLTGLANRARFLERLDHALERVRSSPSEVFVLFLDLDNFKTINDSMGHATGDRTICEVARRVSACLRPGDTAARFGGDEFAVLLEGADDLDGALQAAERLIDAIRQPMKFRDRDVVVSASLGLAAGDADARSDDLVRNADIAMYVAKSRGKGRWAVYEPGMHSRLADRVAILMDLRNAVRSNEMVVHYQPTVSLDSGDVVGAEALVRWQHPSRGVIMPNDFIPLAEESGDIVEIDGFVLHQACNHARLWQDRHRGRRLLISVNVSARQICDAGFVGTVEHALAVSGLEPNRLILEMTETAVLREPEQTLQVLERIRSLGVRIALDDFGTGYSALSYLRRFPIDLLKIDKSFVDEIASQKRQELLAKAVIELGQSLDLQVIAEGIERDDQLDCLKSMHCELGQGFLFSQALEPAAIDAFMDAALGAPDEEAA